MGFLSNHMIAGAAGAAGGGGGFYTHQIANSCRFIGSANDDGTNYMYHTQGTPTNANKCTISAWVKRSKLGSKNLMFTGAGSGSAYSWYGFNTANEFWHLQAGDQPRLESNALFRDTNAWYHIVIANDSTQATAANRNKVYINGVQYTDWGDFEDYSTLNSDIAVNTSGVRLFVGSGGASASNSFYPFDGLIAEYVFIDGTQYAASDFGETKNGVWIPKDPSGLTFGNNGAYLKFESSGDLGNDSSGNNNDFTVTAIATHDQMLDSPTFNSDSNGGNFCTYNPLTAGSYISLSEGNLQAIGTSVADEGSSLGTMGVTSGKWYWEVRMINMRYSTPGPGISAGSASATQATTTGGPRNLQYYAGNVSNFLRDYNSTIWGTITEVETGLATFSAGDKMMICLDVDNKKVWYGKNGSWFNSGNPATGTNPQQSWTGTGFSINPSIQEYDSTSSSSSCTNFGQDGTFAGTETAQGNSDDTGYGNFYYDPPTGFLALCSGNLPTADAVDPAQTDDDYPQKLFNTKLYTGTGSSNALTGVGFQPDWVWIKERGGTNNHMLFDSNRGTSKYMSSNTTGDEGTDSATMNTFGSDGFTVGSDGKVNASSDTYLAWNWRANGGTTSSNATGDITSTVQADPSGGFSIFTYTGSGTSGNTVAHGLSQAPTMTIIKQRNSTNGWNVWSAGYNSGDYDSFGELNTTGAWNANQGVNGPFTAAPGATLLTLTAYGQVNGSSNTYVGYAFSDIEGYIKVGSYIGNGNVDNAFVYTGFRPAFVLTKGFRLGDGWNIHDDATSPSNVADTVLQPNTAGAELSNYNIDMLSNGFKVRGAGGDLGSSGVTYLYLAFAENPFQYSLAR